MSFRAEAVPGDDRVPGEDDVAFTFVDEFSVDDLVAIAPEPVHVRGAFLMPLKVLELRAKYRAADDRRTVRREHHVRQPRHRVDGGDSVAEAYVCRLELLPLLHCQGNIYWVVGIHPWVDRVLHREVVGWAHQIRSDVRELAVRGAARRHLASSYQVSNSLRAPGTMSPTWLMRASGDLLRICLLSQRFLAWAEWPPAGQPGAA